VRAALKAPIEAACDCEVGAGNDIDLLDHKELLIAGVVLRYMPLSGSGDKAKPAAAPPSTDNKATSPTEGLDALPMAIDADEAAEGIFRALARRARVAYVPFQWSLIMGVIRAIPSVAFRRMSV
jgi:hypothetical protein